jgi:uncharacterized repeat protein (TIGR01451 family)
MRSLAVGLAFAAVAAGAPAGAFSTASRASADLRVAIAVHPESVRVGHDVSFRITVRNRGPQPATRVRLTIGLPIGPVTFSELPSRPECGPPGPGPGPMLCRRAMLARGATWTLRVTARFQNTRRVQLTARVRAGTHDPRAGNNRAVARTSVLRMP